MKTTYNKQLSPILHILFWIISINAFNLFFSRGIGSTFEFEGIEVYWWHILLVCNSMLIIFCLPCVWLFKGTRKLLRWGLTTITLIAFILAVLFYFIPQKKPDIESNVILAYFFNTFLYVLIFHLSIVAAVYLNINFLLRRFLTKKNVALYLALGLSLAIICAAVNYAIFNFIIDPLIPDLYYQSWFKIEELIVIMIFYMTITSVISLLWQYNLMLITKKEHISNELSALKAQINPHFLFNNLNTIYFMAEKGDSRTKDVILKLSDFLRYVIYDTTSEKIPLGKEIEIIKTYVELQRERINQNTHEVMLSIKDHFGDVLIAPLILLPLVENCFKHGLGKEKGTIRIEIAYSNNQLHFFSKNRIEIREIPFNHAKEGIGIKNVEKRLNLLYPGHHTLTFTKEGEHFLTDLKINF